MNRTVFIKVFSFPGSLRWEIMLVMLLMSGITFAQLSKLDIRMNGTYHEETLANILEDITSKTGVKLSYSSSRIPVDARITASFNDEPLADVFGQLFSTLPVRYELMDDYIILKKGRAGPEEAYREEEKNFTLNGFIKDNNSGELLIGATVFVPELELGAVSNNYGYFSLTLPAGKYTLVLSYMGYEAFNAIINLGSNMKSDFGLMPALQVMEEVVVSSLKTEEMQFKKVASQSEVLPEQVKRLPSLFGEADVLKNLEMQPGINYYGEGSSYFHVRGGHYDQNLILLDEATLYNPSHMLGIFSPVIPEAVKSVDIYKAGFPVKYGGRLSSVIDIRTRDGNLYNVSGSGSLSIISGKLSLEGPFKKGRSSYFVSYRRSYFDVLLKRISPNLKGLYFYDFTTKFNIRLGPRDRLFITFYKGEDVFRLTQGTGQLTGLNWSNTSTTLRWNHILGSRIFLNATVYGSKYDYYLHTNMASGSYWNSRINNLSLKEELSWFPTPRLSCRFGVQLGYYDFNPGNFSTAENRQQVQVSPVKSTETALYAGAEQEVFKWLAVHYGLRFSTWTNTGKAFVVRFDEGHNMTEIDYYMLNQPFYHHSGLQPRLSLSAALPGAAFLKLSYSRNIQYINLISNSLSPFNSFEVWLPSGPNIDPQKADIVDLGYQHSFGDRGWNLQTDLFWKNFYNQIGYVYHANMLINPLIEGEIRQGNGYAYGFELSVKKETEKFKAQGAYTYLRSFLQIEDINGGEIFPTSQDRPHTLNMSFTWQARPRWMITGSAHYNSGARITTPVSFYYYQGYQVPLFAGQNNDRLPSYSRIDLSATLKLNRKPEQFEHSLTFAIYNMFGQVNPIFLYYNKTLNENGTLVVPSDRLNSRELTASMRYTFVFLPSVTYQFNF